MGVRRRRGLRKIMSSITKTAGGRLRFSFNRIVEGERYRFTKLLPKGWSRSVADAWGRKKEAEIYASIGGIQRGERLIDECVKLYLEQVVPSRKQSKRAGYCLLLLRPYYQGRMLSDLPAVAQRFVQDNPDSSRATVYHRLAFLKAACHYGFAKGIGDVDWSKRIEMPKVRNDRQVYLRVEELGKLLRAIDDEETRALVQMAFYTGLRWRSELLPLQPENVIRQGKELWLSVGMTKNGSPRMTPVHPAIRDCLKWLPFQHSDSYYWSRFKAARELVGMAHVHPHDLRHSLASAIISGGGTLSDVAGALHHESLTASRRYAHLYPERVRNVIFKIGARK